MVRTKPKSLVETAMMSAIASVLCIAIYFIPLFSILNFVVPTPIALVGKRQGLRWSVLCMVVTGFIISFFMGPLLAFFEMASFGVAGVLLGLVYRKNWNAIWQIIIPSVGMVISIVLQFYLSQWIMGVNLIALFQQSYEISIQHIADIMESMHASNPENPFFNEATMARIEELRVNGWHMMKLIMPGGILISSAFISFINSKVCWKIGKRVHIDVTPFPKLIFWKMPRWSILGFILAMVLTWVNTRWPMAWVEMVALNLNIIVMVMFWIEGAAFFRFVFFAQHWSVRILYIIMALNIIAPFISYFFVGAGLMELIIQVRKREGLYDKREEVEKMLAS